MEPPLEVESIPLTLAGLRSLEFVLNLANLDHLGTKLVMAVAFLRRNNHLGHLLYVGFCATIGTLVLGDLLCHGSRVEAYSVVRLSLGPKPYALRTTM